MKHLKYPFSRKKVQQLRFWKLALAEVGGMAAARQLLHGLKGEVRRLAASAAFLLWGAAFFAQSPLHYAKVPVGTFGLPTGPRVALDVDADGDLDLLTVATGKLQMQINTPIGGVPNFGPSIPNSVGVGETDLKMIAAGDMNNDGLMDLVAMTVGGEMVLYENIDGEQVQFEADAAYLEEPIVDAIMYAEYGANFMGKYFLTDVDNDGDTDFAFLLAVTEYGNPCGTSGGYEWVDYSRWMVQSNLGLIDSLGVMSPVYFNNISEFNELYDLNGDGLIDKSGFGLGAPLLNGVKMGQVQLAGTSEYINVGLTEDIPIGSVVMDIDGDSDLDVITHNKVLINMPNHPPTCQNKEVGLDIACEQKALWDYFGTGELTLGYYSFFVEDDLMCLTENVNVRLGHYVKNEDLVNWVNNQPDIDNEPLRGILVIDSLDNMGIMRTREGDYDCDYDDYEYFETLNAAYSQVVFPLPRFSSHVFATQFDLIVQANQTTSFQFQVFDGAMWSDPCTYTILIEEAAGNVYHDQNANGVQDAGEPPLPGYTLVSTKSGHIYTTDETGAFHFIFSALADTITPFQAYQVASIPPHIVYNGGDQNINFGVQLVENIADLRADLTDVTVFRPGFSNILYVEVANDGSLEQDVTAQLIIPELLNVWSVSPPASTISGDTLVWNIPSMGPLEHQNFEVWVQVPVGTPLGTAIDCHASVTGNLSTAELTPANNTSHLHETVIGSFDPNDKTASFGDNVSTWELLSEDEHTYTIRFQNTGTFQADSVAIVDTLDAAFDITTFKIVATSHPMTYIMSEDGVVTFIFDDIFLPDSTTNEPESHGFVKYSLKTDEPLTLGDNIENTAYIYFDFNEAVITNTTNTTVVLPETQALTGLAYHDINDDGIQNLNEPAIAAVPLWSAIEATTFFTETDGTFNRPTLPGDTVSLHNEAFPFADHTNPPHIFMADEPQTTTLGIHFGDHISDGALALTLPAGMNIGQSNLISCTVQNNGNIAQPMRVELLFEDYFGIAPPANALNPTAETGLLTWETPTLQPTESITFELIAELPVNLSLVGLQAQFIAEARPMLLFDFAPADNQTTQTVNIVSALATTNLAGITYHDANDDGQKDPTEPTLPNVPLRSALLGSSFNSDALGQFSQPIIEADSITLDAAAYPFADHTNPPFIIKSATDQVQNIGIHFGTETSNLMADITGANTLALGDTLALDITAGNPGTIPQAAQIRLEFPDGLAAQLVTPATGVTPAANSLTWQTPVIEPQNTQPYTLELRTLAGLTPGTIADLKATVTPLAVPDFAPQNDTATLQVTILDSLTQTTQTGITTGLHVQPNPTAADLLVSLDAPAAIGGTLDVFNALGKRVRTIRVKTAQFVLPTADLPAGVYLVVAKSRDGLLIASVMWTKI